MRREQLSAIAILALTFTLIGFNCFAQTADTRVNVGDLIAPWLQMLVGAAALLITAITGWIASAIQKRTGISIQQAHMNTLQTSLTNAAGKVIMSLGTSASSITFDARNPAVKSGIEYVFASAPEALVYFGLTPEQVVEKLKAKLGVLLAPSPITGP